MTADQSHAVVDRRWVLTSCCGGLIAVAGCTGNGDDDQSTENNDDGTTSPSDDNQQETDDQQQEGDVEPDYLEQGAPEIANWNIETQYDEPIDLVDAELTLDELEISYDILNADAVNEDPEESDQYETDLETTTKLILDQPHLDEPQTKETTTNTVRENHTQSELEDGIRENQTIQLPDDIRNYQVETIVREDGEETQHTEQLNFADLYTEARFPHQFANDSFMDGADLQRVDVSDNNIEIEFDSDEEIGERGFRDYISGISGIYTGTIMETNTPYSLSVKVTDNIGNNYEESIAQQMIIDYFETEGPIEDNSDRRILGREVREDLFPDN